MTAAEQERRAIAAWIRAQADEWRRVLDSGVRVHPVTLLRSVADHIERGQHHVAAKMETEPPATEPVAVVSGDIEIPERW